VPLDQGRIACPDPKKTVVLAMTEPHIELRLCRA
jgi:hypothetical protein